MGQDRNHNHPCFITNAVSRFSGPASLSSASSALVNPIFPFKYSLPLRSKEFPVYVTTIACIASDSSEKRTISNSSGNGVPKKSQEDNQSTVKSLQLQLSRLREEKSAVEQRVRDLSVESTTFIEKQTLSEKLIEATSHAIYAALNESIVQQTEDALQSAAKATGLVKDMKNVLEKSQKVNAGKMAQLQMELAAERKIIEDLKRKVMFLENSLVVKNKELKIAIQENVKNFHLDDEDDRDGVAEIIKPVQTIRESEAALASLLLYPDATAHNSTNGTIISQRSNNNTPSFLVAFTEYCHAVSSYLHMKSTTPSYAIHAYTNLWRAACMSGRRGWRGEIIHAALTLADRNLVQAVSVHPDSRRALQNDLRVFQALYLTSTKDVRNWLLMGLGDVDSGVTPLLATPPLIPLYASHQNTDRVQFKKEDATHEQGDASNGVVISHQDDHDEEQVLTRILEDASDWGEESVVLAVAEYLVGGPSRKRSVADSFYGLKWDSTSQRLVGVLSKDDVDEMSSYSFIGVENIRDRLTRNVEFLLEGLKAQNVLMYGPPGCGKSSMVLSFLKSHGNRGLRLVEIGKEDMVQLPQIVETIAKMKQKFVLFIDDLTFEEYESEAMRAGKAALEGSLRVHSKNTAVFVTSNRRYPVGSRLTDSTLEKLAFSHRFGIVLSFPSTTRKVYLEIVKHLAEEAGVVMDETKLEKQAIKWALGNDGNSHGVSGRTARQFVDFLHSEQSLRGTDDPLDDYMINAGNENAGAAPANLDWTLN